MSCPVDPTAWAEKSRVELGTGRVQEWILARTTRDNPTEASLAETARAVMVKWFEGMAIDTLFADAGGAVDAVRIVSVSDTKPVVPADWQRRESLNPVPTLAPSLKPPLYVRLTFNYRGYAKDMPWPVWTASLSPFLAAKRCPESTDWMLVAARPMDEQAVAPKELGPLDKLSENAPGAIAGLAELVQLLGWGLALYVGVQAVGLVRSFTPRGRS